MMDEQYRAQLPLQGPPVFTDVLHDTVAVLTGTLDIDEVLDRVMDTIEQVMPHDAASLMLVNNGLATVVRSHGYDVLPDGDEALPVQHVAVHELAGLRWMAETGRPLMISDAHAYEGWFGPYFLPWLRSYVGVPVQIKDRLLGFINLGSVQADFFTSLQAERLRLFAQQVAIAIENAHLHQKALALAAVQERQRLARDLHDGVSQLLFSATMVSESLLYLWDREPEKVRKRLMQLHRLTRGALVQMRTLLIELRPEELLEARLSDLIHQLVESVRARTELQISLDIEGEYRLPDRVQVAYYYMALELLNNIASHARAHNAHVQLITRPDRVRLRVTDDGRGFDTEGIASAKGGISIINDRANAIGATLDIQSRAAIGTEVTIDWSAEERNA